MIHVTCSNKSPDRVACGQRARTLTTEVILATTRYPGQRPASNFSRHYSLQKNDAGSLSLWVQPRSLQKINI
jgi:hypothetical protein